MNRITTGACIIAAFCFSACANNGVEYDSSLMNTDSSKPSVVTPVNQNFLTPDSTLGGNGQPIMSPLSQPVLNQASSATTAPGINPPHGQPNHRCEIAVGAPLNSPASIAPATISPATKSPVTTVSATTPVVPAIATPVSNTTAKTVTAPGMNPNHGEPGHRCDIAAGAPLNSPATKAADKTVSTTAAPVSPTTTSPAQKTTAKTVTPAGMNPAHGEPGHRCEIAVGAPLNTPVKKSSTKSVTPTPVSAPAIIPAKKDSSSK